VARKRFSNRIIRIFTDHEKRAARQPADSGRVGGSCPMALPRAIGLTILAMVSHRRQLWATWKSINPEGDR
jgi:hypothetical protein